MIYLDNAATTKLDEKALLKMQEYSCIKFFNPSASYRYGLNNSNDIKTAKQNIKKFLNAPDEDTIIYCSCATEANNTIIRSFANKNNKQMIFSEGEHPSVYNVAKQLFNDGYDVKFVGLQKNGEIDYSQLEKYLQKETTFISIMCVNNETGIINDLKRVNQLRNTYQPNAIFHSDIVQAFGKLEINIEELGLDFATISAHKLYGPKGLGIIYAKNGKQLKPLILGGGQENGLRSGTENIASIMAFDSIISNWSFDENSTKINEMRKAFINNFCGINYQINGNGLPNILSISIDGIRGETLMNMCQDKDVIFGLGSACSSKKVGNRVLESMKQKNIIGSIRISFSKDNTIDEVVSAAKIISEQAILLRDTLR